LHLLDFLFTLNYDVWNHELKDTYLRERGHFNFKEMFGRLENDLASFMLKYTFYSFIRTDYH